MVNNKISLQNNNHTVDMEMNHPLENSDFVALQAIIKACTHICSFFRQHLLYASFNIQVQDMIAQFRKKEQNH